MAIYRVDAAKKSIKYIVEDIITPDKTTKDMCYFHYCNAATVFEEFTCVQLALAKSVMKRNYFHHIVSLEKNTMVTPEVLYFLAKTYMEESRYFVGYQWFLSVHTSQKYLHCHIVINPVHIRTGKKLTFSARDLFYAKCDLNRIFERYDIDERIRMQKSVNARNIGL